jgi:small GTP-binding protein
LIKAIFKTLLIGEGGVGKTSLLRRVTEGWFDVDLKLTVGVDFARLDVSRGGWRGTLQIWDIGGQIRFRDLAISYFTNARLAIAVFDISNPVTLTRLRDWISSLYDSEGEDILLVIVGNKIDLRKTLPPTHRCITPEEGQAFATEYSAPYIETSAKEAIGIDLLFDEVTQLLAERYPEVGR